MAFEKYQSKLTSMQERLEVSFLSDYDERMSKRRVVSYCQDFRSRKFFSDKNDAENACSLPCG